jgi:hypothetical protein
VRHSSPESTKAIFTPYNIKTRKPSDCYHVVGSAYYQILFVIVNRKEGSVSKLGFLQERVNDVEQARCRSRCNGDGLEITRLRTGVLCALSGSNLVIKRSTQSIFG